MAVLHSSKRRPDPLKPSDYDHEIVLVDHTARTRSCSVSPSERQLSPGVISDSSSRRHSDVPLRKHGYPKKRLQQEMTRRKYGKYKGQPAQKIGESDGPYDELSEVPTHSDDGPERNGEASRIQEATDTTEATNGVAEANTEDRGRMRKTKPKNKEPESAIDILYENQRGGFMCGIPLFSSKALGNLDPAPWTNSALKTSATNITNAQVPDPSWEWAWKDWSINHGDDVDEDGWEYSFAFWKKFSWHSATWWNSFVRRRAWIRKRVRKHAQYHVQEAHMLNADYFTIHPAQERSRSRPSTLDGASSKRRSMIHLSARGIEEESEIEDITDITALMKVLKAARIDREKMEAVQNFIQNGGEELYYLQKRMHDIMAMFIFQASRRLLLSHILKIYDEATAQQEKAKDSQQSDETIAKRAENLKAALKHADEEVKRLEFWSDVKDMAEKGETIGAVDEDKGWGEEWTGIDRSGPEDVISKKDAVGTDDCEKGEGNGTSISSKKDSKGKGKEE